MKYDDPNRGALIVKVEVGIFRLCVLLKCTWCVLRLMDVRENTVKAIEDINVLRRRAAFKPGETRNEVLARLYPDMKI